MSTGQLSPPQPSRRSSRPRSASPQAPLSSLSSPKQHHQREEQQPKKLKLDHEKQKNGESASASSGTGSASSNDDKKKDSPAFRLRPRRSTPKPEPNTVPSAGKRFSLFQAMMAQHERFKAGQFNMVKRKLIFNKQKVYPPTLNSEDQIPTIRIVPQRSPTSSITEDIFVSPFVQRLSLVQLESGKDYPANYISLKIKEKERVQMPVVQKHHHGLSYGSVGHGQGHGHDGHETVLKILAKQSDDDAISSSSSR